MGELFLAKTGRSGRRPQNHKFPQLGFLSDYCGNSPSERYPLVEKQLRFPLRDKAVLLVNEPSIISYLSEVRHRRKALFFKLLSSCRKAILPCERRLGGGLNAGIDCIVFWPFFLMRFPRNHTRAEKNLRVPRAAAMAFAALPFEYPLPLNDLERTPTDELEGWAPGMLRRATPGRARAVITTPCHKAHPEVWRAAAASTSAACPAARREP